MAGHAASVPCPYRQSALILFGRAREQVGGLRQRFRIERRADRPGEGDERHFLFLGIRPREFLFAGVLVSGDGGGQIGLLFVGIGGRRRRQERDDIELGGLEVLFCGKSWRLDQQQINRSNRRTKSKCRAYACETIHRSPSQRQNHRIKTPPKVGGSIKSNC